MIERYVANVNSMTFKELPANTIASIVCEEGDADGLSQITGCAACAQY
jgi:hypothetical protein